MESALQGGEARLDELLAVGGPGVRTAAVRWAIRFPQPGQFAVLLGQLLQEPEPAVRELLVRALAAAPDANSTVFRRQVAQSPVRESLEPLYRQYVLARVQMVLEGLSRDGTVPGFYDGQFQALWGIDPEVPELLLRLALDENHHYLVRVLSVMALHETHRATLEDDLKPLLLSEDEEFWHSKDEFFRPRSRDAVTLWMRRRADLSRYTRFALAKSGFTGPLRNMIRRMDLELEQYQKLLGSRFRDEASFEAFYREWLLNLQFETGYYFQQFDDFESAAGRYLDLVRRYPESRSCVNAYYNLACIEAIQQRREPALQYLRRAVEQGFSDFEWIQEDGDLSVLRGLPEFEEILELARRGPADTGGASWLATLTPYLPPGKTLFELSPEERGRVLEAAAGQLTPPERRELMEAARGELSEEELDQLFQRFQKLEPN